MSALFDHIHTAHPQRARAVPFGAEPERAPEQRQKRRALHVVASGLDATPQRELASNAEVQAFSVDYDPQERSMLGPYLASPHDATDGVLRAWASQFIRGNGVTDARLLLAAMSRFIHETMLCEAPCDAGMQKPCDTLLLQSGTGRDFAALMFEAIRQLGFAARFVSGEPNSAALQRPPSAHPGAHTRCNWLQVYLPGEGWMPFHPA